MRFVPFAMSAGNPSTIKAGMVRLEPPPASVLIPPARNPVSVSIRIELNVSSKRHLCSGSRQKNPGVSA